MKHTFNLHNINFMHISPQQSPIVPGMGDFETCM
jgi:hypothetical protein